MAVSESRRPSAAGRVTLAIDFRAREKENYSDTAYWAQLQHVLALMTVLLELCGPDVEMFIDFGKITIREIDLAQFAERIAAKDSDA